MPPTLVRNANSSHRSTISDHLDLTRSLSTGGISRRNAGLVRMYFPRGECRWKRDKGAENLFRLLLPRPLHWSERRRSTLWTSGRELESNKARLTWLQLRQLNEPEQPWCRRFGHSGGHPRLWRTSRSGRTLPATASKNRWIRSKGRAQDS